MPTRFRYSFPRPRALSMRRPVWPLPKAVEPKKMPYKAIGGPFDGAILWLTDGTTGHLRICHRGEVIRGRYITKSSATRGRKGKTEWYKTFGRVLV